MFLLLLLLLWWCRSCWCPGRWTSLSGSLCPIIFAGTDSAASIYPCCTSSWGTVFSVTRRSRSDESHSLTYWVGVSIDFTDLTLVSDDTYRRLYWCDPDDPDDHDDHDEHDKGSHPSKNTGFLWNNFTIGQSSIGFHISYSEIVNTPKSVVKSE